MRILILTNQYPPHSVGGYALSCQASVEQLRARGHTVHVLTSDAALPGVADNGSESKGDVSRSLFFWFRELGREPTIPRFSLSERLRRERANQRVMVEALMRWRPDVVSVWEMGAMSLTTLTIVERAQLPMVITLHDYWPQYALEWDPWLRVFDRHRLVRRLARSLPIVTEPPALTTATVSVISRNLREKLGRDGRWRFPDARVIPFGIDPREFPLVALEKKPWSWKVLYVGRLDAAKGLRTLAQAVGRLPRQATLDVVGHGDPAVMAMMKQVIGATRDPEMVRFSSCARSDLADRYRAADVVVFPSEWDEPFGLVPLEAMACGTPVVATGTGGSGDYLEDGHNCLLFPAGDAGGLVTALERLAADAGLRDSLIEGGSRTAARFSLDRVIDDLEAVHVEAASGLNGPG